MSVFGVDISALFYEKKYNFFVTLNKNIYINDWLRKALEKLTKKITK